MRMFFYTIHQLYIGSISNVHVIRWILGESMRLADNSSTIPNDTLDKCMEHLDRIIDMEIVDYKLVKHSDQLFFYSNYSKITESPWATQAIAKQDRKTIAELFKHNIVIIASSHDPLGIEYPNFRQAV